MDPKTLFNFGGTWAGIKPPNLNTNAIEEARKLEHHYPHTLKAKHREYHVLTLCGSTLNPKPLNPKA